MEHARIEVQWIMEAPEDAEEVEQLFRAEGARVDVKQKPPVGNGVGFFIPISVYDVALTAFITGFEGAAGADAWRRPKRLVLSARDWLVRRYSTDPPYDRCTLILRHPASGTVVYISSDMPDDGFQQLHKLELTPGATYVWDEDRAEWTATGPEAPSAPERPSVIERVRRLFRR